MAEDEYNKKLEILQGYIPFLNNMISQLKDPSKKNREQQLSKMESLHAMITDRKKKLKLETLNKCEDVISKLYLKVNHKPFQAKEDDTEQRNSKDYFDIKPISSPPEKLKFESHIPKVDVYSSAAESLKKAKLNEKKPSAEKLHDFSKPPISLDDLKCLEVDVQEKINETASLKELNDIRNKIATELIFENIKSMNPTDTSTKTDLNINKTEKSEEEQIPKRNDTKSNKFSTEIIKEPSSIFGNILSNVNEQSKGDRKKEHKRRHSLYKEKESEKNNDKDPRKSKEDKKVKNVDSTKTHVPEKVSTLLENSTSKNSSNENKSVNKNLSESIVRDVEDKSKVHVKSTQNATSQPLEDQNIEHKLNDSNANNMTDKNSTQPVYKRLADKYNPKPRKAHVDASVDKVVADIIEQNMIKSPPKIPLINKLTELPPPPPASLVKCSQLEPEIPNQLSLKPHIPSMMSGPRLPAPRPNTTPIPQLHSPRDNFGPPINPSIMMSPRDNFASGPSNSVPMSSHENFISDYCREDLNYANPRRSRYEQPPSLLSLNRILPPATSSRFNPPYNRFDNTQNVDFQPLNHIPSHNKYAIPSLVTTEVTPFQEQKPYGMVNRDTYLHKDDLRWRVEDSRSWDRRDDYSRFRGPTTYKEYREIRENSRDPRVTRDNREREIRDIRDPRLNRDRFNHKDREIREKELKDSTEKDNVDPRLNKGSSQGRLNTNTNITPNRYESKFDRLYSTTNKNSPKPKSPSDNRLKTSETDKFSSPLDSLYNKEEKKTGKGYGVQCFRIPKKKKEESEQKTEVIKDKTNIEKESELNLKSPEQDISQFTEYSKDDSTNKESIKPKDIKVKTDSSSHSKETEYFDATNEPLLEKPSQAVHVDTESELKEDSKAQVNSNERNTSTFQKDSVADVNVKTDNVNAQSSSKMVESSNAPAEQTILAQFFSKLLNSNDKKGKKTALYSLISTFSDTFSTKELSKITKIIKTSEEDSSDEEKSSKKGFNEDDKSEVSKDDNKIEKIKEDNKTLENESKEELEEQDKCINDQTEESSPITRPRRKLRRRRISSSSPIKNYLEDTNNENDEIEEAKNNEETIQDQLIENSPMLNADTEVLVTVGERIKSRKRTTTSTDKPKKKCRSELDKLHEDIQEMFIRDGVLTASGKRMCHLLKDDPSVLSTGPIETSGEEIVKIRKKPGPKPKIKSPITDLRNMKTVRIVIQKIPDTTLEESVSNRRLTRSMASTESDEESVATETSVKEFTDNEDSNSDQESFSQSSDNSQKIKVHKRKRPRSSWASGIIKKKKKRQTTEDSSQKLEENEELPGKEPFLVPEKEYFVDFKNKKSHECRLCDYQGRYITNHYKSAHSDSEVMCSRFSPSIANEALNDAKMNLEKYEKYQVIKPSFKVSFTCRFCTFSTRVVPTLFYDHITTHTGEYRHICPHCGISFCSGKTLNVHITNNHKGEEGIVIRKSFSSVIIFGYLCGECNYVQMDKNKVEEHINIYHLLRPPIHKINMSSIFDDSIIKLWEKNNQKVTTKNKSDDPSTTITDDENYLPNKSLDVVNEERDPSPVRKKIKLKPGPKSKKKLNITNISSTIDNDSAGKSVESNKVTNIRRSIDDIDPEKILPFRSKRAAKEKAQEKLKELMETNENVTKKKTGDENRKEYSANEPNKDSNNKPSEETDNNKSSKETDNNKSCKETENITQENTVQESENSSQVVKPVNQVKKEVNMNVFTCKMDIQEENKKIEQERLLKMEELNKSVGSRSSLNFVDKLCNRLNQHEVIVKQEPNDDFIDPVHQTLRTTSPISMPVLEKNPAIVKVGISQVKKPLLETHMSTPTFDVSQKNDKSIVDMIEKLKGKLDADDNFNFESNNDDDNDGPPPLTHVNDLTNLKPFDASVKTIEICGLIKLLKFDDSTVICCLVPPCVFSTENKEIFQKHCKEYHSPTRLRNSTLCENCGVEIISDANMNLLESVFAHTMTQHEDLLVNQPKPRTRMLRLRKLSGDALSVVKSDDIKKENEKININDNDQNNYISETENSETSINISNTFDDNPFPFKISGIMSLADPEPQPPPLTPITKPNMQIIVKEAKLTTAELAKSKKSEKATKKFIEEVGKLYKCPHYYCLFATHSREYLEKHLKTHKTEKDTMVPCVYCDLKTPWEHVAVHIDIRHANCKYACSYCLYRACLKDYVFLHQEKMHPNQEYVVIALPTLKIQKKFAIADVKIDPKSLCSPYICQPNCNLQFLFENEFREHIRCTHPNNFITCGHEQCSSRVTPSKIIQHWSTAHDISVYQCGYCRINSNELQIMYYHLSQMHQNLNPEILVRLATPIPPVPLGYSPEAFKRMRKIASVYSPVDSNKQVSIKLLEKEMLEEEIPETSTSVNSLTNTIQTSLKTPIVVCSSSNINTSKNNVFLVTTSTAANSVKRLNSLSPPSLVNISKDDSKSSAITTSVNSTTIELSIQEKLVDPLQLEERLTSLTKATPDDPSIKHLIIPSLQTIESENVISSADTNISKTDKCSTPSSNVVSLEHISMNADKKRDDSMECETDPLDLGESLKSQTVGQSSEDESDNQKSDKFKKQCGLLGYQLYRCAFCDFSCSNTTDFKRHVSKSVSCKLDDRQKPFKCVHCKKQFKFPHALVDHIQCHGILRYTCSLCGNKFPSPSQVRGHMKQKHNVTHTIQTALNTEVSLSNQEYIIKPKLMMSDKQSKDNAPVDPTLNALKIEQTYYPDEINKIPIRSIFSSDLRCGVCSYATKVRTNLVRHLQFHSEEKLVSTTAPVNPVPCLEKNEKMFDKMINLASSSHSTGTKMGNINKLEIKDTTVNIPDFVPSHNRYTCCAQDCNYICPEEANLRHHLIALHSEDTYFVCAHCKIKLTSIDADGLIKHLKLHGLQLYKCHYCDFVNNLKHKVEKHCSDVHNDLQLKTVTVRCMETEPKYPDDNTKSVITNSASTPNKLNKPWRCCICKTRSATQEGIQNHVLEKHDIDSQYKCALCIYKTNNKNTFSEHFEQEHNNQDINIVHVYRKIEDEPKEDKESDLFDTTPLWQRDRPRVRHIRGILFDESSPVTSKTSKKPLKPLPSISTSVKSSSNLDSSINAVASGDTDAIKSEKFVSNQEKNSRSKFSDIIIIDDDEDTHNKTPGTKYSQETNLVEVVESFETEPSEPSVETNSENECSEINLMNLFGDFGQPLNKQLKCPVCNKFKSKRISDFIFHLFKEKKVYRFKCGICGDESITYKYMANHVREHKQEFDLNNVITLPRNPKLEIWLQMLIRIQCVKIIASLSAPLESPMNEKHKVLCRYCNKWYKNEQERNEHAIFHWNCTPFKCSLCSFNSFTRSHMAHHFNTSHISGSVPNIIEAGPTVTSELQYADLLHMKEIEEELVNIKAPKIYKKSNITEVLVPEVIIPDMIDESEQDGTVLEMSCQAIELSESNCEGIENVDDLVVVTKTDTNVPNVGDVFCCEYCPHMSDSEMLVVSHITSQHEHMHIKFKILNQDQCEKKLNEYVACTICNDTGSEIKIRQHHLELHDGQTFGLYRYTCYCCQKRFLKISGIKMHFQRVHSGVPIKYVSIFNNLEDMQLEKVKSDSSMSSSRSATPSLFPSQKIWKHYQCTECSYERDFTGSSVGNVRAHVRNHFRAFMCSECQTNFRSKTDASNHCRKEHDQSADSVIHLQDVEERYQSTLRNVLDNATIVAITKQTARKSTSSSSLQVLNENVDLTKIMTSVEINGVCLQMTADKLEKIFDLNPFVFIERCDTSDNIVSDSGQS